ncbi:MAG: DMT family transporter [Alphaproteobacteria bacterium]|nr:DMT family transporter [Alphaproteobacteria bacterium]
MSVANSRLGIAFIILGMALFTINDALGKWLVADYAVGQLIAIRSLVALILLLPLLYRRPDIWRRRPAQPGMHLLRVVLVAAEVSCFYWAVRYLPLAETFMFYLAAPIFVTALSVPLLGERVGFHRWSAILVGFAGVVLILGPGAAAFSWPALIAIAGSMSLALMLILARKLGGSDGLTLITYQTVGVAVAGGLTLPFVWVTPTVLDFSLLGLLGVVATAAHYCLNHAVRLSEPSLVAPFQYTTIIWALILGYLVWGDLPTLPAWIGSAIVITSGLYIFVRERSTKPSDSEKSGKSD